MKPVRVFRSLLVVAAAATVPWMMSACLGDIDVGPSSATVGGGGDVGGRGGEGGSIASGGDEGCITPPDGFCNEASDCACTACQNAAACTPGGCMANGFCNLDFEDSCICADCDWDTSCMGANGGGNCTDDGTCDSTVESCGCADCMGEPTCLDNHQLCAGGAPDGLCNPAVESCSCNDCLGALECLCNDDDICAFDEPCVCEDCWTDSYCGSSAICTNDGTCEWLLEGCACSDCDPLSLCNGF